MTKSILILGAIGCCLLATIGVTIGTIALLPLGLAMFIASVLFK